MSQTARPPFGHKLTGGVAAAALVLGLGLTGAVAPATSAQAQDERPFDNQIRARQGIMRIQAVSLGTLSAMVRGQAEYDAEIAQAAADNLVATSMINQMFFWPEGSGLMDVDNTLALPEIWDDFAAFEAEWAKFGEAAAALQAVAGDGQEALGGGLRGVGQTCGSCHEGFQQSQ